MSCDDSVCGTGGWTGPKPGDPDNNVTLHANQVYGGINVSWSFPLTNANAVAHTILYRGTLNDLSKAVQLGYIGGSIYFDQLDPATDTTYFYWIKIVSINGTVGDPIGPASAIARPRVQQTLESLTGMIDAGKLAQDLKTNISGLTTTNNSLYQEIADRLSANTAFASALADVQNGITQAMTFVSNETTARTDGDNAVVQQVNVLAAANKSALAAIDDERSVRITQDSALATSISQVSATASGAAAAVRDETTARVNADSALAQRITTAESTLNGNTATGQVGLVTQVNTVNGQISDISAEYFAKVEVNGLIGGFGIHNNGALVDAGFDVDRFWVGRTGPDKVKPFIIDSGIVYIDKARIRNADIDTLKVAGNAVTGLTAAYGSGNVPASGSTTVLYASLSMPSGSSGAVAMGTASLYCANNASVTLTIYKNGTSLGSTGVSLQGGFHATASYSALDSSPDGANTYSLGFSNPPDGVPGGNQSVSIESCSLIISGAKR